MALVGFPLLLIPLAICNIIAFLMPGLSFAAPIFTLPLTSGVAWAVTLSDLLLALGILMLLLEVIKGARPGAKYFMDHLLSLVVFGAAAAEFLLLPQFGTSTYFLLTLLALVDFLSGLALRTRRSRGVAVAAASASSAATAQVAADEPADEPHVDSAPEPSTPAAAPEVEPTPPVEAVTMRADAGAREAAAREAAKALSQISSKKPSEQSSQASSEAEATAKPPEPSPEVQSPGIQPGSGAHPSSDTPSR